MLEADQILGIYFEGPHRLSIRSVQWWIMNVAVVICFMCVANASGVSSLFIDFGCALFAASFYHVCDVQYWMFSQNSVVETRLLSGADADISHPAEPSSDIDHSATGVSSSAIVNRVDVKLSSGADYVNTQGVRFTTHTSSIAEGQS